MTSIRALKVLEVFNESEYSIDERDNIKER